MKPSSIEDIFVVLNPDQQADCVPVTATLYQELDQRYDGFKGRLLVSSHRFSENWSTWEIHPNGDEVVLLISGAVEFLLRTNGADEVCRLDTPGAFVVVPRNTWHTAKVLEAAQVLFITPGEGTENREQPPDE